MNPMMILQAIGQGLSIYGEYQEAKIEAGNLEYKAYVAEQDAQQIEKAGNIEQEKFREGHQRLLARQVAIAANSGRSLSGGSPLALLESSERAFVLDEQIMAANKNIAAGRLRAQSALYYGSSRSMMKAARLGVYTKLLLGGADLYKSKAQFDTSPSSPSGSAPSAPKPPGPSQPASPKPFVNYGPPTPRAMAPSGTVAPGGVMKPY